MLNNMDITYAETQDPRGCECGPDHYNDEECSRCFTILEMIDFSTC